VKALFSSVNVI